MKSTRFVSEALHVSNTTDPKTVHACLRPSKSRLVSCHDQPVILQNLIDGTTKGHKVISHTFSQSQDTPRGQRTLPRTRCTRLGLAPRRLRKQKGGGAWERHTRCLGDDELRRSVLVAPKCRRKAGISLALRPTGERCPRLVDNNPGYQSNKAKAKQNAR